MITFGFFPIIVFFGELKLYLLALSKACYFSEEKKLSFYDLTMVKCKQHILLEAIIFSL